MWRACKNFVNSWDTQRASPAGQPPLLIKDRNAALKQLTDEIMCHIAALIPENYSGVYAVHPRLKDLVA